MNSGGAQVDWGQFASQLQDLVPLAMIIAGILGLLLVITGLYRWAMAGRRGDISTGGAIARVVCGVFLLSLPSFMNAITRTFFGGGSANLLSYVPPSSEAAAGVIRVVIYGVQLVGFYAVCRGLYLLATSWDGRSQFGTAAAHLVGGAFAVNIIEFLHAIAGTLGGTMPLIVTNIFG